jgi:hypothetical protein
LDQGFKWTCADPDEEENLDEKDEKMETDENKAPTLDTTPRRNSERLAKPEEEAARRQVDLGIRIQKVSTTDRRSRRIQNSG